MSELTAWLSLSLVPGVGPRAFARLLEVFGSPGAALAAGLPGLEAVLPPGLAGRVAAGPPPAAVAAALEWARTPGHSLLTCADADYPVLLLQIAAPPPVLYLRGRRDLLGRPMVAVVGSRHATPQGERDARAFARALSELGLCVVSGLALGIDAAAHEGGLEGPGATLAVIGTGPDRVYPARNLDLARRVAEGGLIVSEFPLGTPPLAGNFPRRNRLISGLSLGCLVVEAAPGSGSLITARLAAEQGREVFALPGSIHSPQARGCHALIKEGAKLVEGVTDILDELRLDGATLDFLIDAAATEPAGLPPVGRGTGGLLAVMPDSPVTAEFLIRESGLTAPEVSGMLLELELCGEVGSLPGGLYQRLS